MVGTYLPWLGAWILANQAAKGSTPSFAAGSVLVVICTAISTVVAVMLHVPGAGWNVGTFGVAFLPGLALATVASVLGASRK
jgi:F0F1-type ATP synthase assembly protein I